MNECINREAILKNLTAELEQHSGEGDPRTHFVIQRFIKYVEDFPASDTQFLKHGRCVIDNEGYERCSVCNEHETGMRYFTFCPRCGARLDGDIE